MSQKRVKMERRLQREQEAVKPPVAETKKPSGLETLLRKAQKAKLTYVLAAGMAIGAAFAGRALVDYNRKPEYDLKIVFLNHGLESDAKKLLGEVDAAAAEGKPYELILDESADITNNNYMPTTVRINSILSSDKRAYDDAVRKGMDPHAAEDKAIQNTKFTWNGSLNGLISAEGPGWLEFSERLLMGSGMRGLIVAPLESRTQKDYVDLQKFDKMLGQDRSRLIELVKGNASLGELKDVSMKLKNDMNELTKVRNAELAGSLQSRLDKLVDTFPELGKLARKGEPIRVISYMGDLHNSIIGILREASPRIRVTSEIYDGYYPIERLAAADPTFGERPCTEREGYLLAVQNCYLESYFRYAGVTQEIKDRILNNAMSMTLEEWKRLDSESEIMPTFQKKAAYIVKRIYEIDTYRELGL